MKKKLNDSRGLYEFCKNICTLMRDLSGLESFGKSSTRLWKSYLAKNYDEYFRRVCFKLSLRMCGSESKDFTEKGLEILTKILYEQWKDR